MPLAALGVVLLMLGAAVTHLRRRELPNVAVDVVLGGLAASVSVQRFDDSAF